MRIEVPLGKRLTHEMVIPLWWGGMDAMGQVSHSVHFRYFEIAWLDGLLRVGGPPGPRGTTCPPRGGAVSTPS